MSLHYLVKLEMLIAHVLLYKLTQRNSKIYPALTVASEFVRLKSR